VDDSVFDGFEIADGAGHCEPWAVLTGGEDAVWTDGYAGFGFDALRNSPMLLYPGLLFFIVRFLIFCELHRTKVPNVLNCSLFRYLFQIFFCLLSYHSSLSR
jgi:hypothetical protein